MSVLERIEVALFGCVKRRLISAPIKIDRIIVDGPKGLRIEKSIC